MLNMKLCVVLVILVCYVNYLVNICSLTLLASLNNYSAIGLTHRPLDLGYC
ncbi:hypothetical protein HanRHA438_Chr05g0240031 [Helianthus annuus]|nr:hypothetical protein HanRHA438_Chr05g0240031 [Helianthus annuus]